MKKICIAYGEGGAVMQSAIAELTRIILDYTMEYPVCKRADADGLCTYRCIYIGTKENNPYIRKNSHAPLSHSEEYDISSDGGCVMIEGYDEAGVLYGVLDFYNRFLLSCEYTGDDRYCINPFEADALPLLHFTSRPSVRERGLWTWSHVIYDYRGYIDNMMRLKMNSVIIWCDYPPVNAAEMVDYAHSRNIKVIWGYPWLWDTDCSRFDLSELGRYPIEIFQKYEREYAAAGGDGIYFQTFTELHEEKIGDFYIAEAAAELVNRTVRLFYDKYPDIRLQFGLHATSVSERLEAIATVDPRVQIVWEDAGAFPFSYMPSDVGDYDRTRDFAKRIARLRGEDDHFGIVTKGMVKLDWTSFQHPMGAAYMTEASRETCENRLIRKRKIWRYVQAYWLVNYGKALDMVSTLCKEKSGRLSVYALVEDGMFEKEIYFPVALYAEMLWNADADPQTLPAEVGMRKYITFA